MQYALTGPRILVHAVMKAGPHSQADFLQKHLKKVSDKPLKPLLRRLTNRTNPRRLLPCAEIPADLAAPDRQGKDRFLCC